MRRAGRLRSKATIGVLVCGAALFSAGCAPAADAVPAPAPSPSATPVAPYGDGTLTIATLLPRDGEQATAEMAAVDAVARSARAATDAGAVGVPPVRVVHRGLGSAGDGSIAATVADLATRGADVVLVRADGAALSETAEAAAAARILVLNISRRQSVGPDGTGADLAAGLPGLEGATASRRALVAVADPVGDRAADLEAGEPAERVVRVPVRGTLPAAQRDAWGDDLVGATVAGSASSPATLASAEAIIRSGVDAGLVTVRSDIPLPASDSAVLAGARGIVDDLPATERELAAIRAEDFGVVDPGLGVSALRLAELATIGAVLASDDGGLTIGQELPGVLAGDSACASIAVCADVLAMRGAASYLPIAGARILYTETGWTDARSVADSSM